MKKVTLSLAVIAGLSMYSTANADSLLEALTDGKMSGEFTTTYENRKVDKEISPWGINYYSNTSYAVGSFALKYETGVWNDISLTSKFRAYTTLFEEDKNSTTSYGTGDASERFREKDGSDRTVDLEELFLTYTPMNNISIKTGRQFISTDWVNKTHDAVRIDATFEDTSLEAIWSARTGRIYSRDYRPMDKFNKNDGVYKLGLTQKFTENISATAYDAIFPDLRDIIGGKVNLKYGATSIRAHYAASKEDTVTGLKDSNLIDFMASTSIAGFSPYAGYIKVDDDAAFPGYANSAGEIIVPFEEGDYVYSKGAETIYLGVSKSIGDLSATLLYGMTEYLDGTNNKLDMDETTLWLGYPVTKDIKANLGYTMVNEVDGSAHGDYDQLNITLAYTF